jgi:hypothetical protein
LSKSVINEILKPHIITLRLGISGTSTWSISLPIVPLAFDSTFSLTDGVTSCRLQQEIIGNY